jgi:methionyl-tRNA formyltransferase
MSAEVLRPRRIVYFGTPDMAVPPLEALVSAGFEVMAVVTRVDKRRGRGGDLLPSPVKRAAEGLGLPVLHTVDEALSLGADLGVVVAFGQLVKPHALAVLPMVNLHFSLLPRWRGAAPVERAILAGDGVTGVCLMQVAEGLDTGDVYECVEVAIGADETAASLRVRLVEAGSTLLVERLRAGLGEARPQEGEVTYAAKVHPDDLRLDWSQPAAIRHRVVRLGGAHTTFRGRRLKVLAAELIDPTAVGDTLVGDTVGGLRLATVQPESKGPMPFAAFANGARPAIDERMGA